MVTRDPERQASQGNGGAGISHVVRAPGWRGKISSVLVAVARSSPLAVLRRPSVNITRGPDFTTDPSARSSPLLSVIGRRYLTARSIEV